MRDDIQVPDLIMTNADEPSSGASYDVATPQVSLQSGSAQSPPNSLTDRATVKNQARESEASRSLAIEEVHIKSEPLERYDGLRDSAYGTPERSSPTYAPVNHAGMAALSNGVIDIVGLYTQPAARLKVSDLKMLMDLQNNVDAAMAGTGPWLKMLFCLPHFVQHTPQRKERIYAAQRTLNMAMFGQEEDPVSQSKARAMAKGTESPLYAPHRPTSTP
jgi:hypothetical protein